MPGLSLAAQLNQQAIPNQAAAKIVQVAQNALGQRASIAALTTLTVTATTGTLPTPDGSVTIANAATPTVVELLEFCMELRAKVASLQTGIQAQV